MNALIKWFGKRAAVDAVNDILAKKSPEDVKSCCETIRVWTARIQKILDLLEKIASRCEDAEVTSEEVD